MARLQIIIDHAAPADPVILSHATVIAQPLP
jgi:hypothetical protein